MIKAWKFSFQPSHELLHGDPSLPTRTRSLEFSWTDAVPPKNNRALDVLQRLSYSEYLQISAALNYALVHDARFYPSFLRTDHLPRPHRSESELLSGLIDILTALRRIELGGRKLGHDDALQPLLQSVDLLEKLSIRLENHYLPSWLGQALVAARHSVRVFTLEESKMCRWRAVYHGSCLDLRGFEKLKRTQVVSPAFGAQYADSWRRGLYRLLPNSLLELQFSHLEQASSMLYHGQQQNETGTKGSTLGSELRDGATRQQSHSPPDIPFAVT